MADRVSLGGLRSPCPPDPARPTCPPVQEPQTASGRSSAAAGSAQAGPSTPAPAQCPGGRCWDTCWGPAGGHWEVCVLENDRPQVQRLVPWDTGHEEFTEPARSPFPALPTPQIHSNHLEQDLVVVFFKEIKKIVPYPATQACRAAYCTASGACRVATIVARAVNGYKLKEVIRKEKEHLGPER